MPVDPVEGGVSLELSAAAAVAGAQPIQGLYIGAGVGANFAGTLSSSHDTTKVYTDPGPLGLLAVGWGFGNGLRAEIEGSYRSNGISGISTLRVNGQTLPLSNVSGNAGTYAVMANVAYDIPLHPFGWPLQPYIGAGAGYGWLNFNNAHGNGFTTFHLPDNNTFGPGPDLVSFGVPPAPVAAAPAAAPAPAVAPARSYLVFFDWDMATLTDRARQIISEAASNTTKVQYTRIEVNGYTDTSGTPQYNQGLSARRAQTVAEELVKDGVPKAAISIQSFGETHLLVPTGPGVREPQNRRVEIIIR